MVITERKPQGDYFILEKFEITVLEKQVRKLMENGWQPIGGPFQFEVEATTINYEKNGKPGKTDYPDRCFGQALIRRPKIGN